ncbi:MAG: hypothetical protein V1753_06130 [Pseudomonadota bacterium]
MNQNIMHRLIIMLLLLIAIAGCVKLERPSPVKRRFMLDMPKREACYIASNKAPTLKVRPVLTFPGYDAKGFVYCRGDGVYESDFYNEFFISPCEIITGAVSQWLNGSGIFRYVVGFSSYTEPSFILEGTLVGMYGDYSDKKRPKAVMALEFLLIDDSTPTPEVLMKKEYRKEIDLAGSSSSYALVKGWGKALEAILVVLEKDIKLVLDKEH